MTKTISIFLIVTLACLASIGQTKDSLYVFVGKKIEVVDFLPKDEILLDKAFKAKYEVIQNLFGNYNKDTIEFEAYDHYGEPTFSYYDYVLLFVLNCNGKLYHLKRQWFDVYKTKNGRWASGYHVDDYRHPFNKNTTVKPEKIDFVDEVSYKIRSKYKEEIEAICPAPYYKIEQDKAIVVWGNYVEQLFELKKTGILKSRGIFE